jgi:hypothetical protein
MGAASTAQLLRSGSGSNTQKPTSALLSSQEALRLVRARSSPNGGMAAAAPGGFTGFSMSDVDYSWQNLPAGWRISGSNQFVVRTQLQLMF